MDIRASYLRAAEVDDAVLGNVREMRSLYLKDVNAGLTEGRSVVRPHTSYSPPVLGGSSTLRVVQYNCNVIYGPCFDKPYPTANSIAELLLECNADILFLQEAAEQTFPDLDCYNCVSSFSDQNGANSRVLDLQKQLEDAGYCIIQVTGIFNPPLVATRLPVVETEDSFNLDGGQVFDHVETRGARRVLASLGPDIGNIALVATHLHHTDKDKKGVRLREIREIIDHLQAAENGDGDSDEGLRPPLIATVLCTDMNAVRQQDYNEREWAVVVKSLAKAREPHSDGVPEALEEHGFKCTYDWVESDKQPVGAPPITHWTGTCVDYCWVRAGRGPSNVRIKPLNSRAVCTTLSDHLPVVHDLAVYHHHGV